LETFSFGRHLASNDEFSLTPQEEEQAFAALEHCATHLYVVQIHTALESIRQSNIHLLEPEIEHAFQISRLIRNAFAHNSFAPLWKIGGAYRGLILSVPDVISLDTTAFGWRACPSSALWRPCGDFAFSAIRGFQYCSCGTAGCSMSLGDAQLMLFWNC
jgi:hypothetical protein